MIATPDALLTVFVAAYGPGLDDTRARVAMVAALAEQRRLHQVTGTQSEIQLRRLRAIIDRVCARYHVTEERLRDLTERGPEVMGARAAWAWEMLEAGFSSVATGVEIGLSHVWAAKAARGHRLRVLAGQAPSVRAGVTSEERSVKMRSVR